MAIPTTTSAVETSSKSYARIANPRLLLFIRVLMLSVFTLTSMAGIISLPSYFQELRNSLLADVPRLAYLANLGVSAETGAAYTFTLDFLQCFLFSAAGLIIFYYRSDDWVAVLLSSILIMSGMSSFAYTHSGYFFVGIFVLVQPIFGWLHVFPLLCLFPDGRFTPSWSRWLIPIYFVGSVPLIYCNYLWWVHDIVVDPGLRAGFVMLLMLFWLLGAGFLFLRTHRTTSAVQRQQIKQMATGTLGMVIPGIIVVLLPGVPLFGDSALFNVVVVPLINSGSLIFFLIMLTFSILRYRLWEIDLALNRGIVYTSLTGLLVLVFIAVVLVLQSGLQALLGSEQTTLAAMISAGAVVGLFNPIRLRLQQVVDRQLFGLQIGINQISAVASETRSTQISLPNDSSLIGKKLGSYEIQNLIGQGGMGEVYLAYQSSLNRQVAIKVLLPHLSRSLEFRTRFEREARTVAKLHHPNIIGVLDFGEIQGLYYMVMDYIQGEDLGDLLHKCKVLAFEEAMPLLAEIADALDYAHQQGVIHRDIKPSNIMLRKQTHTEKLQALLMDFGLTRLVNSSSDLTNSGPIGTLAYMAPEQIISARAVDQRADIYALGVMAFQILTGKLPFPPNNQAALLFAHLNRPAPDPVHFKPDLPPQVCAAILKALAKDPAKRPQSAGAFAAELAALA
jgi:tRNA A-37 threonylcarbamoyl transferase component Bud32